MAATAGKDGDPITEINVTPLVDVCLVLVIIFMAVSPFALMAGINVLHSSGKVSQGKASSEENVQVRLRSDGRITINNSPVAPGSLQMRLLQALDRSRDRMVILSADATNHVGQVVEILDTAKLAGARKLAIMKD